MISDQTIPLVARARAHVERTALIEPEGQCTYGDLLDRSARAAAALLADAGDLAEARVAYLVAPGIDHVATQWGIWRAGGMAVPLCPQHPGPELAHVLDDADASVVVVDPAGADRIGPLAGERGLRVVSTADLRAARSVPLPRVAPGRRALLVYTSGSTSRPKGAVSTHAILAAQTRSLVEAWAWRDTDHILHVLPLHHVHGIVNVLACALWSGAACELLPRFDAGRVWQRIADADGLTLFMAVPTIYARMVRCWHAADEQARRAMSAGCRRLRLMVSGSAALPVSTLQQWRRITGHTLLERYGMTEIGMALSNPLRGERRAGCVGVPLPGVQVRLVDEAGQPVPDEVAGEIQVKGPTVFGDYWRRPEATAAAFTADGWFRTGDVAVRVDGVHRILGRQSVDIIKTGGYKVSALEIEEVLRTHEAIADCAVVGVADAEWGERVAAAAVLRAGAALELADLRAWAKRHLAPYKVPTRLRVVADLPRNPMGKVVKPEVVRLFP